MSEKNTPKPVDFVALGLKEGREADAPMSAEVAATKDPMYLAAYVAAYGDAEGFRLASNDGGRIATVDLAQTYGVPIEQVMQNLTLTNAEKAEWRKEAAQNEEDEPY